MRRALRGLRFVERERLGAVIMLGLAAVAIACGALLAILWGNDARYLIAAAIAVLGGVLLALLAVSVIIDARRRERLFMDRIIE